MSGYIERLVKCGYPVDKAIDIHRDFLRNFSIADLDIYVRQVEIEKCGCTTIQTQQEEQ